MRFGNLCRLVAVKILYEVLTDANSPTLKKSCVVIFSLVFSLPLFAQSVRSQTCIAPDNLPIPHVPQGNPVVFNSGTVYYYFENIPDGPEKTQIITAFGKWNAALVGPTNCSGVFFSQGPPADFSPILRIRNGTLRLGAAARTDYDETFGNELWGCNYHGKP